MTEWAGPQAGEAVVQPPPIGVAELWPWALFAAALIALIAFVSVADGRLVHEFLHDGRHLMAFPCH